MYVDIVPVLVLSNVLFVDYVKSWTADLSVLLSQRTAEYFLDLFNVENFCMYNLNYSLKYLNKIQSKQIAALISGFNRALL